MSLGGFVGPSASPWGRLGSRSGLLEAPRVPRWARIITSERTLLRRSWKALRELEKALTNYHSAEAVSCCGPLRSCRHRKIWAAKPKKTTFRNVLFQKKNISKCSFLRKEYFEIFFFLKKNISKHSFLEKEYFEIFLFRKRIFKEYFEIFFSRKKIIMKYSFFEKNMRKTVVFWKEYAKKPPRSEYLWIFI